ASQIIHGCVGCLPSRGGSRPGLCALRDLIEELQNCRPDPGVPIVLRNTLPPFACNDVKHHISYLFRFRYEQQTTSDHFFRFLAAPTLTRWLQHRNERGSNSLPLLHKSSKTDSKMIPRKR